MTKQRNQYSKEFKEQAVQLVETSGKSTYDIAADLGIDSSMLRKWCRDYRKLGNRSFPGNGHQHQGTDLEEENRRLRKELHTVMMERDILKKAVAIFSQPQK